MYLANINYEFGWAQPSGKFADSPSEEILLLLTTPDTWRFYR